MRATNVGLKKRRNCRKSSLTHKSRTHNRWRTPKVSFDYMTAQSAADTESLIRLYDSVEAERADMTEKLTAMNEELARFKEKEAKRAHRRSLGKSFDTSVPKECIKNCCKNNNCNGNLTTKLFFNVREGQISYFLCDLGIHQKF